MLTRDKILYWFLVPIVCAIIPELFSWKVLARLNDWIPKNECPNVPIELSITSPGNNAQIPYIPYAEASLSNQVTTVRLNTDFVVKLSRELTSAQTVGFVYRFQTEPITMYISQNIVRQV